MSQFFNELKRRNVIKAAIAYVVVAWVILQVLSIVLPSTGAPEWVMKTLMLIMMIGFPVWVFISWVYEVTPEGLKKTKQVSKDASISATTDKRLNILILVGLFLAITVGFFNKPTLGTTTNSKELVSLDKSIAVLPFDDMSSGGDTEWFCDGVTEDILTNLSKLKNLKVISRTSTERYKNTDKSIPEIAAELGVSYIVEGSVRKHEDKVIITAQLIDANDTHVWAQNYNDDFKEVFKIQQDVSQKIVKQLKIAISPEEQKIMTTAPTNNVEAYQLVLKGKDLTLNVTKKEDIENSIKLFGEAITLDKNYAEAYAELGYAYLNLFFWNNQDGDYLKKSRENTDKALLINPNTAKAYITRAIIHDELNDGWEETSKDYEKAITINPNDASAHYEYGVHFNLKPERDLKNYLIHINKAQELDPLSSIINFEKVRALARNELIDEAQVHLDKISNIILERDRLILQAEIIIHKQKDNSKALDFYFKELEKKPNSQIILNNIATLYDADLNDNINATKYLKMAYEADSTNAATARSYQGILCEAKQFVKAQKLGSTANFKKITSNLQKIQALFYYQYHQENYKETEVLLKDSLLSGDIHLKILVLAQLGNKNEVYKIFENGELHPNNKAFGYAILKERDSMYFYLNKDNINDRLVNSRREFDPYRKEERYRAFMKKNNLPFVEKYNGKSNQ